MTDRGHVQIIKPKLRAALSERLKQDGSHRVAQRILSRLWTIYAGTAQFACGGDSGERRMACEIDCRRRIRETLAQFDPAGFAKAGHVGQTDAPMCYTGFASEPDRQARVK